MSKNAYFFPHDCNARNDARLVAVRMRHGAEGYGTYFMILERLGESSEYMSVADYNVIAFDLRVSASLVKSIVEDFGLFSFTEDGKFYSDSFLRRMRPLDNMREQRQMAGAKSAAKRWGNQQVPQGKVTVVERSLQEGVTVVTEKSNKGEYSKEEKEKKEKETTPHPPQGGVQPAAACPSSSPTAPSTTGNDQYPAGKAPRASPSFRPPTIDQIAEYCKSRGNGVDAATFRDFYEAKGWMVGKNKMKDWQAAVRTWEKRTSQPSQPSQPTTPRTPLEL